MSANRRRDIATGASRGMGAASTARAGVGAPWTPRTRARVTRRAYRARTRAEEGSVRDAKASIANATKDATDARAWVSAARGCAMACALMVFVDGASARAVTETYVATLRATEAGRGASGTVTFVSETNRSNEEVVVITADVRGLTPGKHGINVHENGDVEGCDDAGKCTGGSYNPEKRPHRVPTSLKKFGASACHGRYDGCILNRHIGDLGNIVADENGVSTTTIKDLYTSLKAGEKENIAGRSVVIRAGKDDYETDEDDGNAGPIILYGQIARK